MTNNAIVDMTYHFKMLQAMGLEKEAMLNIHVGGAYGDKDASISRFYQNF